MSNQSKIAKTINDAYFTPSKSSQFCIDILKDYKWISNFTTTLEPCAGDGSLAVKCPGNVIAKDIIDYGYPVVLSDYLTSEPTRVDLVLTNPPYGRCASLAKQIFNKATLDSDRVAMILPATFRKISCVDTLNQWFHPVVDEDLPDQHFILPDGSTRLVKTIFQMWEKRNYKRGYFKSLTNCLSFFTQVDPMIAEYAFRGQGSSAGKILDGLNHSPASTRFLSGGQDKISRYDWTKIASFTAGIPAIGLRDVAYGLMLAETYQPTTVYLNKGLVSHLIHSNP